MDSDVEVSVQVAPKAEDSDVVVDAAEESGSLLPAVGSPAEFVSTANDEIGVHVTKDCG
jgi:hypothetical protein